MSVDLRELLGRFGGKTDAGITVEPTDRSETVSGVEIADEDPVEINCEPLDVSAWVDGIQNSVCLTWEQSLPICAHWTGAGGSDGANLVGVMERLYIISGEKIKQAVERRCQGIEIEAEYVPGDEPYQIMRNIAQHLAETRDECERELVKQLLGTTPGYIVCDGSIASRPLDKRVVGVVKTTNTRYFTDETQLWSLPQGWRSSRFKIPAAKNRGREVHSCYVRLQDATKRGWDFGLVRVESFERDLLEPLASLILKVAQDGSRRDERWDRHVLHIKNTEELLRSRRPALF